MNLNTRSQNVPKLRFANFSKDWSKTKLGSISFRVDYGIASTAVEFDGENKYLRITDIDEQCNRFLPNPLCSPQDKVNPKYVLKEGDIVFARTGASVGKSYLFDERDGRLIFAGYLIRFSIDQSQANPEFIFQSTLRFDYRIWVSTVSKRSGQPGINAEEYKSLQLFMPNIEEQQKIASFLSSVDTRIELLCKKKELLEQYRKGLMQKIFSRELRFRNENGRDYPDWEEVKLATLGKFVGGGTPNTTIKEYWKGDIPWITSAGIEEGDIRKINISRYITMEAVQKSSTNILPANSVMFASRVGVGKVAVTNFEICISQDFTGLILETEDLSSFLAYQFVARKNLLVRYSQGTSISGYTSKELRNITAFLPVQTEQQKIADFLSSIDKKIELVAQQIDRARIFKKGLLQQMFI